jgi:hypothetical protein
MPTLLRLRAAHVPGLHPVPRPTFAVCPACGRLVTIRIFHMGEGKGSLARWEELVPPREPVTGMAHACPLPSVRPLVPGEGEMP